MFGSSAKEIFNDSLLINPEDLPSEVLAIDALLDVSQLVFLRESQLNEEFADVGNGFFVSILITSKEIVDLPSQSFF